MTRKLVTFVGQNFALNGGTISVSGVDAGDQILAVVYVDGIRPGSGPLGNVGAPFTSAFAPFVIADGEIQQVSGLDNSFYTFTALLERRQMLHN